MSRSTRVVGPIGRRSTAALGAAMLALAAAPAQAQVSWTDWTSAPSATSVVGTLTFGGNTVDVTYTGPRIGVQFNCGTNYWTTPSTYTGPGVPNAPSNCEIIQLSTGGTKTITFSQAVVNPLLALVSWNVQPNVQLSAPFEIVNIGPGYWGNGTLTPIPGGFSTNSEVHGTLRLLGSYTTITFTDGSENWHGFTVGATDLAVNAVPEPGTVALVAGGLLALGAAARRRRG